MALKGDKTANGAFRDAVRALYQDILYFQNVLRCHGTPINVISFRPIKVQYFLHPLSRHTITFFSPRKWSVWSQAYTRAYAFTPHTEEPNLFARNTKRGTKLHVSINLLIVQMDSFRIYPQQHTWSCTYTAPFSFTILRFAGSAHPKH